MLKRVGFRNLDVILKFIKKQRNKKFDFYMFKYKFFFQLCLIRLVGLGRDEKEVFFVMDNSCVGLFVFGFSRIRCGGGNV